jgi:hypothetical protein
MGEDDDDYRYPVDFKALKEAKAPTSVLHPHDDDNDVAGTGTGCVEKTVAGSWSACSESCGAEGFKYR